MPPSTLEAGIKALKNDKKRFQFDQPALLPLATSCENFAKTGKFVSPLPCLFNCF